MAKGRRKDREGTARGGMPLFIAGLAGLLLLLQTIIYPCLSRYALAMLSLLLLLLFANGCAAMPCLVYGLLRRDGGRGGSLLEGCMLC